MRTAVVWDRMSSTSAFPFCTLLVCRLFQVKECFCLKLSWGVFCSLECCQGHHGYVGVILGLSWDSGKYSGNCYNGLFRDYDKEYIGIYPNPSTVEGLRVLSDRQNQAGAQRQWQASADWPYPVLFGSLPKLGVPFSRLSIYTRSKLKSQQAANSKARFSEA